MSMFASFGATAYPRGAGDIEYAWCAIHSLPKAGGTVGPRAPEDTIAEIVHQIFSYSGTTLSKGYWRGWAQNISYPRSRIFIFMGLNGHHASLHVALVTGPFWHIYTVTKVFIL
ncbi:hypothetical protein CK203_044954 [Vitis vinifera]|uniref:Uncharacterized protein n=1 Tax=Vitis vinifera TaxID=29760 RepID=A0A438HFH5_VITVI|nr:hypothetical protein CK203_044954 [Vitis vinifera]